MLCSHVLLPGSVYTHVYTHLYLQTRTHTKLEEFLFSLRSIVNRYSAYTKCISFSADWKQMGVRQG